VPSYAELQRESAWNREYLTDPMREFCDRIASGLGIPRVNVGSKGDNLHLNGGHRSQRWILTSRFCTNRTYTVWGGLPENLMDALGAIDITPKSKEQMLLICQRLDRAVRAGLIEEVVAWYGNVDGDNRVDGYDNIRNVLASSDSSHLWHLHITFNRWALAIKAVFDKLYNILMGLSVESSPTAQAGGLPTMMLFQVKGADVGSVHKSDGFSYVGVPSPDDVRNLLSAGANGHWLEPFYGGKGAFPNMAAAQAAMGKPVDGARYTIVFRPEDLVALAAEVRDAVTDAVVASPLNSLGDDDKPTIKEAIEEVLREKLGS
jgi:hypothetical protein